MKGVDGDLTIIGISECFLILPPLLPSKAIVVAPLFLLMISAFIILVELPLVEIPIEIPSMEYFLIWHKSDEGDGGHIWMKDLITSAFKEAQK